MKVLLIDDVRDANYIYVKYGIEVTHTARNFAEGIAALKAEKWDLLLLDHDLCSYEGDVEKTGTDVMKFLEENPQHLPGQIEFVTANPAGRVVMAQILADLKLRGLIK